VSVAAGARELPAVTAHVKGQKMKVAIRAGLLGLMTAALFACGGSGAGSGGPAPTADAIVGEWKVKQIVNESKLGGLEKDLKKRVITLEAGGKFKWTDPMTGTVNGTWTLSGNALTLTIPHEGGKPTTENLSAEGSGIYDRQAPGGVVIEYEKGK
jgi:hypothetical protein